MCMVDAVVVGTENAGGIIGYSFGGTITNCANLGKVHCGTNAAGILGGVKSSPVIDSCYNYGELTATKHSYAIVNYKTGKMYTVTNCYYLIDFEDDAKATAKTAEQFASGEVTDLLNNGVTDSSQVWYQTLGQDPYPVFKGMTVYKESNGSFTNEEPDDSAFEKDEKGRFVIKTYADLELLAQLVRTDYDKYGSADYIINNTIKAGDDTNWAIGIGSVNENKPFNGTFDGNGNLIVGLNVSSTEYGGVFEIIGEKGVVKNVNLIDFDYNENNNDCKTAGGIAAINYGEITRCLNGANLTTGVYFVNGKKIQASQLNSNVRGVQAGGIAAENYGKITGTRSASIVVGSELGGGIAAVNNGEIYACINNGAVGNSNSQRSAGMVGINNGSVGSSYTNGKPFAKNDKFKAAVVGTNNGKVSNVYYTVSTSTMLAVCEGELDNTNIKTDNATLLTDEIVDTLNSITSDEFNWIRSNKVNMGFPTIQSNLFVTRIQKSLSGITVKGSMHSNLKIDYALSDDNNEITRTLKSKVNDSTAKVYQVSVTDSMGNEIPAELLSQGNFEMTVPTSVSTIYGVNSDGEVVELKAENKDGNAVIQVDEPLQYILVSEKSDNTDNHTNKPNDTNRTSTDNTVSTVTTDSNTVNTGSQDITVFVMILVCSMAIIGFTFKNKSKIKK